MTPPRTCCLDLDTFFVSVERLHDPSLRGRPVVVGAAPGHRGVVTAASYEVRALGVRSGMSMTEARRLAPDAVYLPTRHGVYEPFSARVRAVAERFCPGVQPASIDEFYLDLHGCEAMYRHPVDADDDATILRVVWQLRDTIQREIGLPSSVGIGTTRTIAKMASGRAKPAGVLLVPEGGERAFVWELPVRKYPGIGPVTEGRLVAAGVTTLGQLLELPPGPLRARFDRLAEMVRRGIDGTRPPAERRDRPAFREHDPEGITDGSLSNERTFFADLEDVLAVEEALRGLVDRVCWRARRRGIRARTVTLKLRYADFTTLTRCHSGVPTHDEGEIWRTTRALLHGAWDRRRCVRLLGVALSGLEGPSPQLPLPFVSRPATGAAAWEDCPPRGRAMDERLPRGRAIDERPPRGRAIDAVRARFGFDAVHLGSASPVRAQEAADL